MMILDELAMHARVRVEEAKKRRSLEQVCKEAMAMPRGDFRFAHALSVPALSFICEVKKASPSKGILSPDFPYLEIARSYEAAGADCISVLTEPKWFLGSEDIFREIRHAVRLPMLRKDFTIDEYQIYEAKLMGADAVLLICALLDTETIRYYLQICNDLGLTAVVETHDAQEIASALSAGAKVVGINHRNLKDFSVDLHLSGQLSKMLPQDVLFVAESGVSSPKDVAALKEIGAHAVLVGEYMMRQEDKKEALMALREAAL